MSRGVDVPLVVDHLRYYAGWADRKMQGRTIPTADPMFAYTLQEPVGQTVGNRVLLS
jgi:aldehyde dehydrogenase (NAD+)